MCPKPLYVGSLSWCSQAPGRLVLEGQGNGSCRPTPQKGENGSKPGQSSTNVVLNAGKIFPPVLRRGMGERLVRKNNLFAASGGRGELKGKRVVQHVLRLGERMFTR